jgi:chromosome segregation ATPase
MTLEETKGEVSPTAAASSEDDEDEVDEFVVQLDRAYSELDSAKVRRVELDSLLVDLDVQRSEQGEKLIAVESVEPTEEEEAIRACKEAMRICGNELVKQQDEIAELKRHVVRLEGVKGEAEGERDESYEQRSKLYAELTREEAQTSRVASLAEHQVEPMVVTLRSELAGAEGRSNRLEGDADAIKVALVDAEVSSVDLNKQLARVHRTHTRELAQETQLKNDLVRLQEVEIGLQAERVELTSKMTLTKGDARALLTSMMTVDREKEKGLQKLKATQFRMVKVQQNLQALTAINDDRTLQIKHIKRSIKNMSGKIETTADERSRMETSLMTNKATKEAELKAYRTVLQNRDAADRSVAAARKESYELERARKKAERSMDQADADATQAHEDARQAELDFADVKSTMTEARERLNRLEAAENDVKDLYQAMKNEKNKFASQTTALAQRVADMNDKFKMLANEMEILRASALERKVGFTLLESKIMEEHRIREKILTEESDCRARNKELRDSKRAHNADTKLVSGPCFHTAVDSHPF